MTTKGIFRTNLVVVFVPEPIPGFTSGSDEYKVDQFLAEFRHYLKNCRVVKHRFTMQKQST